MDLVCVEWTNVTRNAKLLKHKKYKHPETESPYLTHIVGKEETNEDESKLACICSNQMIYIYGQSKLELKSQIKYPHGDQKNKNINDVGFFKTDSNNVFSCGDDGKLKIWDLRTSSSSTDCASSHVNCFEDSSESKYEFLTADINSNDHLLIVGTNQVIDSSYIYIFDVRFSSKYLFKLNESHSGDIMQVKCDPIVPNRFASGGIDGLVCLFDLDQKDEENKAIKETDTNDDDSDDEPSDPDLIFQCFNTMSSVHKIGYTTTDELFAITLNGLFVYSLNSHDLVFKSSECNEENEDYILDCFYMNSNKEDNVLTNLYGTKDGNLKFLNKDTIFLETERNPQNKTERHHRDIVRDCYWNSRNLYTVGEDGFLLKWNINKKANTKEMPRKMKGQNKRDTANNSSDEELNLTQKNHSKKKKILNKE